MSLETPPKFDYGQEEAKILEGVESRLVSILNLVARRPLTEKPQ
jgi:hypothetical protein